MKPILFEILAHSSMVIKQEDVKQEDELAFEASAHKVTKRALSKCACSGGFATGQRNYLANRADLVLDQAEGTLCKPSYSGGMGTTT
ncbi:hypothetical protein EWM64_g9568 [Hericium alpestre]|uniref:Uncharacterized protein n=1 Tax=Hericium alpestre TaxID=135208 RepID=A0A4Y9ZJ09_9AGAM|nr:hypothetical protein EWM64_g9568 [Hericium alpestre]